MNSVILNRLADAEASAHGHDCVIDVRSPAEFDDDHLPGAINLPVLDNAEHALVGTIYKQQSAFAARKVGAALVARNAARHIEGALAHHDKSWRPLVYCWRGGQRSGAFATILSNIGWRVGVVEGGYKTWRRLVTQVLDTPVVHRLLLLDGNTGTAKTAVLGRLASCGAQVVDLESLAHHRGSLFGHHALAQPSQRSFESSVARALSSADTSRVLFLEAESARIGVLHLPGRLRSAMLAAPRIEISAPLISRANYLVGTYSDIVADPSRLLATIDRLRTLHPTETISSWRSLAESGRHVDLALSLMQLHYDPSYTRSRARARAPVKRIEVQGLAATDIAAIAERVMREASEVAAGEAR